jgi:hypothetical protein
VLGRWRSADYDRHGQLIGVEFLRASQGIDVSGLPDEREVVAGIRSLLSLPALVAEMPPAA